jgi:hypothetical protein
VGPRAGLDIVEKKKGSLAGVFHNDLNTASKNRQVSPNFRDILLYIISQNSIQYYITNIVAID